MEEEERKGEVEEGMGEEERGRGGGEQMAIRMEINPCVLQDIIIFEDAA